MPTIAGRFLETAVQIRRRVILASRSTLHWVLVTVALSTGCNSVFGIHEGKPRSICADELMIDDMEDGDGGICASGGRNGGWYDLGDLSAGASLTPRQDLPFEPTLIEGRRSSSRYAARFSGSGFTEWGAVMGFTLNNQGFGAEPYPVSNLGGITFWMKSNSPVSVQFRIPETISLKDGGQCTDSPPENNCNNDFSFQISAPSSDWEEYEVPFSALRQLWPGGSATWNPRLLIGIQFSVGPGAAFDVWVDDIRFYYCSTSACAPTCTDLAFPVRCPASNRRPIPADCRPPGTDCAAVDTWCTDPLLIDDMEDGDSAICQWTGRQGSWFAAGDGTSADLTPPLGSTFVQALIPGGRGTSRYAARLTGSGFTDWGAMMGLGLWPQPYDASQVGGIKFSMKNNVPTMVLFPTVETAPPDQGGQCADQPGEYNCGNWFSFKITTPSSDWKEYEVPFSALRQTAGSATWKPSPLLGVSFAPRRDTPFDVWVDDVQFYDCPASGCLPTCADLAFPVRCPATGGSPAGCRPRGTDCATFVLGCGASNTPLPPTDGNIATFRGTDAGTYIAGDILAVGAPAPTYTTNGSLHITLSAPATSTSQTLLVVDRFKSCVDATAFTGVQFSLSGSISGCTLRYFTEDSVHLYDDGDPTSHSSHGIGRPGAYPPAAVLMAGQVTSMPQTLMVPFAAVSGGIPERPIDKASLTGLGWAIFVDASTGGGTPSCVADLTIDDVRFY